MTVTALIVAAGSGSRLGDGMPKQFRSLAGRSVLRRAVEAFSVHPRIDTVRVVIGKSQLGLASEALAGLSVGPFIIGGVHRADSVRAGLAAIGGEIVLVHDAARPFCPSIVVDRLLDALLVNEAAVPVIEIADTLARACATLGDPIPRDHAVRVQTPQAFRLDRLRAAYDNWSGEFPTDESAIARAHGITVACVEGDACLDKLTTPADWIRAEAMLVARRVSRTGLGFDVHAFAGTGPIMLGGIQIAHERGLAGNSDADVVLHAVTDALLGAAALGDIGDHFPPSDPRWSGADSAEFLEYAAQLARGQGAIIDHVDVTIICEAPKVGPYRSAMVARIAAILGLWPGSVSIKATTTERLGFTGRGEGIAAQAVANIRMEIAQ